MTSKAEWAKRVEAWRASGKSLREFCNGRDYSAKSMQWWAWHLRKRREKSSKSVDFVRVVRKRETQLKRPDRAGIVVQVGGARVELDTGADRAALAMVLDVLLASSGGRS